MCSRVGRSSLHDGHGLPSGRENSHSLQGRRDGSRTASAGVDDEGDGRKPLVRVRAGGVQPQAQLGGGNGIPLGQARAGAVGKDAEAERAEQEPVRAGGQHHGGRLPLAQAKHRAARGLPGTVRASGLRP